MTTKNRVLALLEKHRGEYLSGEEIAISLLISRSAVWKAINSLRDAGYPIDAVTNKGYCLSAESDVLSVHGISKYLRKKSDAEITVYPSLISTNQTAKELALAGAEHGTVVLAETQTGGKGRFARQFFSPPGGLYLSAVLHPDVLNFTHITAVTAFAAWAVCDAVEAVTGMQPEIKWVNDLFLGGKKICGILTEAVTDIESGSIGWIVVGIGLNAASPPRFFPPDLREIAASLYPQSPPHDIRNRLAAAIIARLVCEDLPAETEIFAQYRKRMMRGRTVTVVQGDGSYTAVPDDIDEAGHLIVVLPDGSRRTLRSGEIRILPHMQ